MPGVVAGGPRSPAGKPGQSQHDQPKNSAGDGADDGHPEFSLRVGGFLLDLSDASEQKKRDFMHWNSAGLGDDRVRQLVRKQAGKEKQACDDGCAPHQCITPIVIHGMELCDQRKRDQQRDYQPTIVQAQLDSEYCAQLICDFTICSRLSAARCDRVERAGSSTSRDVN